MDARITGETDNLIGLSVIDNKDVEHVLDVRKADGKITAHQQDGYPDDADKRTSNDGERISQVCRYAKYHVTTNQKCDALPWDLNPDRFEMVRETLADLSTDKIEELFDELLYQCLSHYEDDPDIETGDVTRPVPLPDDLIGGEDAVMYRQEIYLDENDEIETTSGIIVCYYVAKGDRRTKRYGTAPDRDPDARIEISPVPIVSPDPFRDYLRYHLRCQVRDCYLGIGIEPPEEYKVLGPGLYKFTVKYLHFDLYPEYFDKQAQIPGYEYDFTPSSPIPMEKLASGMINGDPNKSLYDRVRNMLFSRSA